MKILSAWAVVIALALVAWGAAAQEVQYEDVDGSTLRILAMGEVELVPAKGDKGPPFFALPEGGHGTGFAVTREGLAVTAAHVVAGAKMLAVHVPGVLGPRSARVLEIDEVRDVAFLHVAGGFEHVVKLAPVDTKLPVRSTIFALGYPFDATMSTPQSARGAVSGRTAEGLLQLSISVNPGNSGGPVIDEAGLVFGMVSSRVDPRKGGSGLAQAVPLSSFSQRLTELSAPGGYEVKSKLTDSTASQRLADMVSLVAHDGGAILGDTADLDADEAKRAERQIRRIVDDLPRSADAALLGAAFFYNRFVLQQLKKQRGRDKDLVLARELGGRAAERDADLAETAFVKHLLGMRVSRPSTSAGSSSPSDYDDRPVLVRYESRAGMRGLGVAVIVASAALGTYLLVGSLAQCGDVSSTSGSSGCHTDVGGMAVGALILFGGGSLGFYMAQVSDKPVYGAPAARRTDWAQPTGASFGYTLTF